MKRHIYWSCQQGRKGETSSITIIKKMLGAQVHLVMHWKEHILDSDDSLIKSLNTRAGA